MKTINIFEVLSLAFALGGFAAAVLSPFFYGYHEDLMPLLASSTAVMVGGTLLFLVANLRNKSAQ